MAKVHALTAQHHVIVFAERAPYLRNDGSESWRVWRQQPRRKRQLLAWDLTEAEARAHVESTGVGYPSRHGDVSEG